MSEEKPVFKVTDRRLFNPDGTPRDVERAEEAPASHASDADAGSVAASESASPGSGDGGGAAAVEAPRDLSSEATSSAAAFRSASAERDSEAATAAAGGDPQEFVNLVMFIASPAAAAMGMTEHPGMTGRDIDLQLAKHCIDLLGTLEQKTAGKLSIQEEQILEGLLAELRMQYVSLTSAVRPGAPGGLGGGGGRRGGGLTGSDITGGR